MGREVMGQRREKLGQNEGADGIADGRRWEGGGRVGGVAG